MSGKVGRGKNEMKKIIIQISGGLGNQMFQYALGRSISLRHRVPLTLDISWFLSPMTGCTKREFMLGVFPHISFSSTVSYYNSYDLPKWKILCQQLMSYLIPSMPTVNQPYFAYWPQIERISPPVRLIGYWQSEKFFSTHAEQIKRDFYFPSLPEGLPSLIAQKIQSTPNSVALHIRRGDYVNNADTQACHGNIIDNYYKEALNIIKFRCGKSKIFIFSDEPEWVKRNFDCCGHSSLVVDLHSPQFPHHEMHLMSLCKHHIIANSTFSWWGAWLAKQPGITIAPHKWFAKKSFDEYKDIYCKNWIIL